MNKYRELAAAIRKGHTMIKESVSVFVSPDCGCALGAAWYGTGKTYEDWLKKKLDVREEMCAVLGITEGLRLEISGMHFHGKPRLAIADWLDTLADDVESVPQRESDQAYASRKVAELMEMVAA